MRRIIVPLVLCVMVVAGGASAQERVRAEAGMHPRIAAAVRALEDAIKYMEAAPHDFGGHKAEAIQESKRAIEQLRLALAYRAKQDRIK